ncbi:MAG: anthranilate synthase component I [Candidatus Nitronauta litoralis]|uniref:Anthranilate synthase component 1 n=1 Tax=Candidatus Nitronauta litoralis TaxID=2705533 RepID=A0A7T0BYC3_9BACT|nr:MAG: anthranilate synthase component I [Candidatus Nitronauta litoralis]
MLFPSLDEFKEKASKGNLIPVCKEIIADLDTPVSAYMKIGHGPYSFLLESVEGGEKWARYCFLGCNPSTIVRTEGRTVAIETNGETVTQTIEGESPLSALRKILKDYEPVVDDRLPRFFGGAVGFISYDMVRFFEELPDENENDLELPDSLFVITDTLLIFDNVSHTIKIVSNAHTDQGELEEVYRETIEKIEKLEQLLRQPTPEVKFTESNNTPATFESNFQKEDFLKAVERIKDYINEGDAIQVVLAQRLKFTLGQDPFTVYRALRTINPSPYMYYLNFGDVQIVGSSPEVLVRLENNQVEVRPIAGTRPRGKDEAEDVGLAEELLDDDKEVAEHIMLVDLGRNDLGRVSQTHSVEVNEQFTIERYSHVMHIVSNVRGQLKQGLDSFDVLEASFPAGTVSGAPKIRAMEIIDEMEPTRRGVYSGSVGYISFNGNMDTAIAIRTLVVKGNTAYLGVGAGIVADSVPEKEFEETMNKGKALLKAIELAEKGLQP